MADAATFLKSEKNKNKLVDNGYMYHADGRSTCEQYLFWRCCKRKTLKCKARVHSDITGKIVKRLHEHSHDVNSAEIEIVKIKAAMKDKASTSTETISEIVQTATSNLSLEARDQIGRLKTLKRQCRRYRDKSDTVLASEDVMADTDVFLKSARLKNKLIDDGYIYHADGRSACGSRLFWRCSKRKTLRCKARVHTDDTGMILKRLQPHTHGANTAEIEIIKAKAALKDRALTSSESISLIVQQVTDNLSSAAQMEIGRINSLKRQCLRYRNAAGVTSSQ